jgi:predicted DNA-binding helix-hairpin-helix protein
MDNLGKLAELSEFTTFEVAEEAEMATGEEGYPHAPSSAVKKAAAASNKECPVYWAALPNGKRVPLLKTLLTSACERNCNYCCFRSGRDFNRQTFKPDEMASTFMQLHRAGTVQGIFLSSGMAGGGIRTQDRLIDTAEILRQKMDFKGYLHLKIMPGAEKDQVERAMQLADRVSINLEAPTTAYLSRLAPEKVFLEELLKPLQWVEEIRRSQPGAYGWNQRWPSSTTQFVVGAADESDLDLLRMTSYLHRTLRLGRVYFSGFNPVSGTPLENQLPINPWRRNRLYQASFLLRDYGFDYEDLPFTQSGDLPLGIDPKQAWAQENLSQTPVEINRATYTELIHIPGIGPRCARRIMAARHQNKIRSLDDLKILGIRPKRTAPFILLDGKRPLAQLSLW